MLFTKTREQGFQLNRDIFYCIYIQQKKRLY